MQKVFKEEIKKMASIPTCMLTACKWEHPVQRYSLQQQRDSTMTQLQNNRFRGDKNKERIKKE